MYETSSGYVVFAQRKALVSVASTATPTLRGGPSKKARSLVGKMPDPTSSPGRSVTSPGPLLMHVNYNLGALRMTTFPHHQSYMCIVV